MTVTFLTDSGSFISSPKPLHVHAISGSLTQTDTGLSAFVAGTGISIVTSSIGQITIASTAAVAQTSPYIDNWGSASTADDEFDSGSDSMNTRGWEVWNLTDNVSMTWAGKLSISTLPGPTEYKSTRYGTYMAIQVPANKAVAFIKTISPTPTVDTTAYMKFGMDWRQDMYDFGSFGPRSDSPIMANRTIGMYTYAGASGSSPVGQTYCGWYFGFDSGNSRWGIEYTGSAGSTNITSTAVGYPSILGTDQLVTYNGTNGPRYMWLLNSTSGHTLGKYETNQTPARPMGLARIGFRISHSNDQNSILVDHFRVRYTGWFGLT